MTLCRLSRAAEMKFLCRHSSFSPCGRRKSELSRRRAFILRQAVVEHQPGLLRGSPEMHVRLEQRRVVERARSDAENAPGVAPREHRRAAHRAEAALKVRRGID